MNAGGGLGFWSLDRPSCRSSPDARGRDGTHPLPRLPRAAGRPTEQAAPALLEFLAYDTTCINELLKRITSKKIVKKNHLSVAARLPRRHVTRAAWAKDGKHLPP
jgi:hypothetical protein